MRNPEAASGMEDQRPGCADPRREGVQIEEATLPSSAWAYPSRQRGGCADETERSPHEQQLIEGLFAYHHEQLLRHLDQRLASFGEELIEKMAPVMRQQSKPAAAPPAPGPRSSLWPASVEDQRRTEDAEGRRPSLGTELLMGYTLSGAATTPSDAKGAKPRRRRTNRDPMSRATTSSASLSAAATIRPIQQQQTSSLTRGDFPERSPRAEPGAANRRVSVVEAMEIPNAGAPSRASASDPNPRKDTFIYRLVHDKRFEAFFGFLIFANAIFIGVQTDHAATGEQGTGTDVAFEVISNAFALLFTVELALKIWCSRCQFFCAKTVWQWNMLDLFVVATSLAEAAATVAIAFNRNEERSSSAVENQSTSQFRILRIVRISRVIKIVRVVRLIRFIRALRTMVHQLMSTMKPLLWAIVLLCLIMYLFAILFTQSTLIHRIEEDGDIPPLMIEYWSTLPRSMLALFMSITNGISWGDAVGSLSVMGPLPVALYIGYIAFVQFAVLNILTGVFCQNAIDSASHDQELVAQDMLANKQMYIQNMQQLFKDFDHDQDGTISLSEFMRHLDDDAVRAYFDSLELDTTDIHVLFRLLDTADHNELELEEFVQGCMRLKGNAKGVDMAKLSYAQSAMARRLARFMERTDVALAFLMERTELPEYASAAWDDKIAEVSEDAHCTADGLASSAATPRQAAGGSEAACMAVPGNLLSEAGRWMPAEPVDRGNLCL